MSYLLSDFATEVRRELEQEVTPTNTSSAYKDQFLIQWVKDFLAVHARDMFREGKTTISVVEGTAAYDLPADFLEVQKVVFVLSGEDAKGELLPVQPDDGNTGYYLRDGKLYVQDGSQEDMLPEVSGTLTLYYLTRPTDPTSTSTIDPADTIDVPNREWYMVAKQWVKMQCVLMDSQEGKANFYAPLYEQALRTAKRSVRQRFSLAGMKWR